jgi:iron complex outermembrane receptor protein
MPSTPVRSRIIASNTNLIRLLGSASLLALGSVPALAQPAATPVAAAPVEEVLITGSLIHGAPAVGVPVTSLGAQDFQQSGALTVTDVLKNVPAITQLSSSAAQTGGGANTSRGNPVNIHGLNAIASRTLVLFDGLRYPPQNQDQGYYDPSVVPALAVSSVDVLTDGASATYGSDALAGVVNVILRRRYDGAISQARAGYVDGAQGLSYQATQMFGTTWDGGDITLTYELYHEAELKGSSRPFYTFDFTPFGLDDRTIITSAIPGIVSTGAPSQTFGTGCTNCYSVPRGTGWDFGDRNPASTTTWTQLLANKGVNNLVNPYLLAPITPVQDRSAFVGTFDQELFPGVELFAEGFYSNRRAPSLYTANSVAAMLFFTQAVPTTNPYYPAGAPAGLRVSYTLAYEAPARQMSVSRAGHYALGFNLDLPFDWNGRLAFSVGDHLELAFAERLGNPNMISAAVGNTIASVPAVGTVPGQAAFTKPANIPYLNLFCDPTVYQCNSPATLAYIQSYRRDTSHWVSHEWNFNFDGPVLTLPGGELRAAVGALKVTDNLYYSRTLNVSTFSTALVSPGIAPGKRSWWATYAQINVPIVGPDNMLPLVQSLVVEAAYRYDKYSDFGGTKNPKISVDWMLVDGLTLRGSWGTSFRAPAFAETSRFTRVVFRNVNLAGGATSNASPACITVGGTPVAGSAAAALNPTCSAALQFPGGVNVGLTSGAAIDTGLEPSTFALGPEEAQNLSAGVEYAPSSGIFQGVSVNIAYFFVKIRNAIASGCLDLNDPACRGNIVVEGDPNFIAIRDAALAHPASTTPPTVSPSAIRLILDNTAKNQGSETAKGVDFNADYNYDTGNFGVVNLGVNGTYYISDRTVDAVGNVTDPYVGDNPNAGVGNATFSRLRWRTHLGWTDGTWSTVLYVNYKNHRFHTGAQPAAAVRPANYSNLIPSTFLFDLSLGYNTGTTPPNSYMHNINFQFVAINVLDRMPPFAYNIGGQDGLSAYDTLSSPIGRQLSFTITKTW